MTEMQVNMSTYAGCENTTVLFAIVICKQRVGKQNRMYTYAHV